MYLCNLADCQSRFEHVTEIPFAYYTREGRVCVCVECHARIQDTLKSKGEKA